MAEMNTLTSVVLESARLAALDEDEAKENVARSENIIKSSTEHTEGAYNCITKLEEGSKNIEEVIKVINIIAEQTNLLALNAAIEAARAGEHGRGFSVVADEVQSLATKTQESTKNIHTIITNIQKDTSNAVEAIDKSKALAYDNQASSSQLVISMEAISLSFLTVQEKSEITVKQMEQQINKAKELEIGMISVDEMAQNSLNSASELVEISKKLDTLGIELSKAINI